MPVDPKYAGLPGIAWDQPDMFETVPGDMEDESNDNTDTEEEEKLHLSSLSWLGDLEVGSGEVREFSDDNRLCIVENTFITFKTA